MESNRPLEPALLPHQIECIEWARGRNSIPIMLPYGFGKSATALKCLQERNIKSCLIIAPKPTLEGWVREIRKFTNYSSAVAIGNREKRLTNILSGSNIILINPEGVRVLEKELLECVKENLFEAIVVDELTKIRRWSKQTQAVLKIAPFIPLHIGLCGKLITESMFDPFNPFRFLDNGATFGNDYFVFRDKYFQKVETPTGIVTWEPTDYGKRMISGFVKRASFVRKLEDVHILPKVSFTYRTISLSPQQSTYLEVLQKEWTSRLPENPDHLLDYTMQIHQKAYQCINGFVYKEDGTTFFFDYNPKLQELNSILEEHGNNPFIVWHVYKAERAMIESLLEKTVRKICPSDKPSDFDTSNYDCFVASFDKHALGINLKKAPLAIYYSRPRKFLDYDQSQFRNRRADSTHKLVSCQIITSKHPIERLVDFSLRKKKDLSDYVASVDLRTIWNPQKK